MPDQFPKRLLIKNKPKTKFAVMCAWCCKEDKFKTNDEYEKKGYRISHGMCEFHANQMSTEEGEKAYWSQFDS